MKNMKLMEPVSHAWHRVQSHSYRGDDDKDERNEGDSLHKYICMYHQNQQNVGDGLNQDLEIGKD